MTDKNKKIFAKNFNYYLSVKRKTQNDIVEAFGITASTVSDWAKGKKYPRVDKMQMLADYFGVLKSDLADENIKKWLIYGILWITAEHNRQKCTYFRIPAVSTKRQRNPHFMRVPRFCVTKV